MELLDLDAYGYMREDFEQKSHRRDEFLKFIRDHHGDYFVMAWIDQHAGDLHFRTKRLHHAMAANVVKGS